MFYRLKQAIMCKALERRNAQNPFDAQTADNYTLEGATDPLLNNSYYFSAHSGEMSFFARLGKRVHEDETWFALYLALIGLLYLTLQFTGSPMVSEYSVTKVIPAA